MLLIDRWISAKSLLNYFVFANVLLSLPPTPCEKEILASGRNRLILATILFCSKSSSRHLKSLFGQGPTGSFTSQASFSFLLKTVGVGSCSHKQNKPSDIDRKKFILTNRVIKKNKKQSENCYLSSVASLRYPHNVLPIKSGQAFQYQFISFRVRFQLYSMIFNSSHALQARRNLRGCKQVTHN